MKYFAITYRYNEMDNVRGSIVNEEGLKNLSNTPNIKICTVRQIWC